MIVNPYMESAIKKSFARMLKMERVRKGLTQAELGEKSALSLNTIRRYENQLTTPSLESFFALSYALRKSPFLFMSEIQEKLINYLRK